MNINKRILSVVMGVFVLLLVGCSKPFDNPNSDNNASLHTADIFAMDTFMTIKAYCGDDIIKQTEELIYKYEKAFSTTDNQSDISRINSAFGKPVDVCDETAELIRYALQTCESTNGTLDITIYPVLREWGFTTGKYKIPTQEKLAVLMDCVDYSHIELNGNTVLVPDGCMLDLGAVAKGYTGDKVITLLKDNGVSSAIINLGGNVQTLGTKPDGSFWKVGISDPALPSNIIIELAIADKAVVTSGSYERFFVGEDGIRYSHIIDPKSGMPVDNGLASVTVVSESGLLCDALSTALFVMGLNQAVDYWCSEEGFEVIFILDDGNVYVTEGLENSFSFANGYKSRVAEVIHR